MRQDKLVFCTVFDKNYLIQGLALYQSLVPHCKNFVLYCLCMDQIAADALAKLNYPNIKIVTMNDLNQSWIELAKSKMSWGQICWTMQPIICSYVLSQNESHVTYLEADSYFFNKPEILFDEIGDKSISLVPHAFSPEALKHEDASGIYCVQFNYFKNNEIAKKCLDYWRESCFKYNKNTPLYLPGQICLNDWETNFKDVAIVNHPGAGVAPWNVQKYKIEKTPTVDGKPVVFYHYHQLARYPNGDFDLGTYPLSNEANEYLYIPYMKAILKAEKEIKESSPAFNYRREVNPLPGIFNGFYDLFLKFKKNTLKTSLKPLIRKIKGVYNVVKLSTLTHD